MRLELTWACATGLQNQSNRRYGNSAIKEKLNCSVDSMIIQKLYFDSIIELKPDPGAAAKWILIVVSDLSKDLSILVFEERFVAVLNRFIGSYRNRLFSFRYRLMDICSDPMLMDMYNFLWHQPIISCPSGSRTPIKRFKVFYIAVMLRGIIQTQKSGPEGARTPDLLRDREVS